MRVWAGGKANTSLYAATTVSAGLTINYQFAYPSHTMVVTTTGAPTTIAVNLEGSHDGVTWQVLGTQATAGSLSVLGVFTYVRANLTTLTGGTAPTITATIASSQGAATTAAGGGGGGLTDAQLRNTPVPVSVGSIALPTGASTSAKQPSLGVGGTASTDVLTVQGIATMVALKVDGSAVTQPVSGNVGITGSVTLPTGASTSAKQPALGTAGAASTDVLSVQGIASGTALKVDGSAVTQPVSAAALPLPTGAATAAKQPAVGTAGVSSVDVLSVQGIASGTALKTDGSATTQPVSAASLPLPTGAATAAKQPAIGTAGVSSVDVITVQGIASGTAQPVSAAALPLPTGAATSAKQPALGTAGAASADVITVQGIASGTAQPVTLTDGTNVASVLKSDGTAAGQNSQMIAGANLSAAFTLSNIGVSSTVVDGGNYAWVSVQITGFYVSGGTAGVTFQGSNDNTNWQSVGLTAGGSSSTVVSTASSTNIYHGAMGYRYFRITTTGSYTSGSTVGTIVMFTTPRVMQAANVSSSTGIAPIAGTVSGATQAQIISTAAVVSVSAKGSVGNLYSIVATAVTTAYWLKLYDKATAPTVGTDTPLQTIFVPVGANIVLTHPVGIKFAAGIAIGASGAAAVADTTALAAGQGVISYTYA